MPADGGRHRRAGAVERNVHKIEPEREAKQFGRHVSGRPNAARRVAVFAGIGFDEGDEFADVLTGNDGVTVSTWVVVPAMDIASKFLERIERRHGRRRANRAARQATCALDPLPPILRSSEGWVQTAAGRQLSSRSCLRLDDLAQPLDHAGVEA